MDFLSLDPLLRQALQEDLGRGDITTDSILPSVAERSCTVQARIVAKESLILAGWPVFLRVFELLAGSAVQSELCLGEGRQVDPGTIGSIRGEAALLLKGERVALNFLQRMCGIATQTRKYADLIGHTRATLLDTRKTTPLWRSLEKYAVRMGGGQNHRLGLDDGILLKENHIALAGGVRQALRACTRARRHLQRIEIELQDLNEVQVALEEGADVILLDNMSPEQVRRAVAAVRGRCQLEVSGGINEQNIVEYAETGVDFISLGALTHSYRASDISLLVEIL
ncbi:MAG: carboxylating nicotinate-nucleotide diphosphorylase [Acidobacteriota bacterium]